MTYATRIMDEKVDHWGKPWIEGDLRVYHFDGREYWSVTKHWDKMYAVSWFAWYYHGGQVFHDGMWTALRGGYREPMPAAQDQAR